MKKVFKLSLVMLMATSVILAGCGNKKDGASDVKIGLVTDVGGVNDKSFNQSAWEALEALNKESGVEIKYLQSKANADYVPNLNQFVKGGYDLTWGSALTLGTLCWKWLKPIRMPNWQSSIAL